MPSILTTPSDTLPERVPTDPGPGGNPAAGGPTFARKCTSWLDFLTQVAMQPEDVGGGWYNSDMLPNRLAAVRQDPWLSLRPLCEGQFGVFSRDQALDHGFTRSQLDDKIQKGQWIRMLPKVYTLGGIPISWEASAVAALLWAGEDTFLSHRSAARLWGLGGFDDAPIEVTSARRLTNQAGVVVHSQPSFDFEVSKHGPFRITSAARTLIDLGSVLSGTRLEFVMDEALRKGLVTVPRLHHALDQRGARGRKGAVLVRDLLSKREPNTRIESILERKLLNLLRDSILDLPLTQFDVYHSEIFVARLDFAYPDRLVAIEADGFAYHSGRVQWQLDLSRRNRLTSLGWLIIHVTWEDVTKRPQEVVNRIRSALETRPL